MTLPCIYQIRNVVNNHIYIGSANRFSLRKKSHLNKLRGNRHHNRHLQNAFNLYGESKFIFEIIERLTDSSTLLEREDFWIQKCQPTYNVIRSGILNHLGLKRTEATKRKISQSLTGKTLSEETKQKLRKINLGKKQSAETIEKKRLKNFKPILQLTLDGNFVKEWVSATDAENNGYDRKCIYRCLWGKRPQHRGFRWQYKHFS